MKVLFAPDYRAGLPYQARLATALEPHGFEVIFLSDYSRGLPLFRGWRRVGEPPLVHLHWPEAYFYHGNRFYRAVRVARYGVDLSMLARRAVVVLTAHNLFPHNRWEEPGVKANIRRTARAAAAIFVHSEKAAEQVEAHYGVARERCQVIPYGDHSLGMMPPLERSAARRMLGLGLADEEKLCLMYGTVDPYKGMDEVVAHWMKARRGCTLAVVGPATDRGYAKRLHQLAGDSPEVIIRDLDAWMDDGLLRQWLSAADCTIFNYRQIFTSGAASLARSFGLPILIPRRLDCADLQEPHSHVFRFEHLEGDFDRLLGQALATPPSFAAAAEWREHTRWENVASLTAAVYRQALAEGKA